MCWILLVAARFNNQKLSVFSMDPEEVVTNFDVLKRRNQESWKTGRMMTGAAEERTTVADTMIGAKVKARADIMMTGSLDTKEELQNGRNHQERPHAMTTIQSLVACLHIVLPVQSLDDQ